MALLAQHRGVHGDFLAHAGKRLFQGDLGAQQRVVARLDAGARLASAGAAAEERLEDVADAAKSAEAACAAGCAAALLHRVAAAVDDAAFLRIQQHLLGERELRELLLRLLGRVHVRVVFAGELAVRLLDLLLGGFPVHAEDAVIVTCQNSYLSQC